MFKKALKYALIICIAYIAIIAFLGFRIRDDFFALTFPSWPFLINCFENCGYKILIALLTNGILVGLVALFFIYLASYFHMIVRKFYKNLDTSKKATKHDL